jgi:hypothetical protein
MTNYLGLRHNDTSWGTPLFLLVPQRASVATEMATELALEKLDIETEVEVENYKTKGTKTENSSTADAKTEADAKNVATEFDLQQGSGVTANPNIDQASSPKVAGPNLDPHLLALEASIRQYRARTRRIRDEYWSRLAQLRRQERADRILSLSAAKADHDRAIKEDEAVDNFEADARKMS